MKSILISIRPEWVAKILSGEKTIEIRKTFPKCDLPIDVYIYRTKTKTDGGGVVAKFRLRFWMAFFGPSAYGPGMRGKIAEASCLTDEELENYADGEGFYAWPISDLEIFDEPKPLSDFGLKRAPQSWQYVEVVG